MKFWMGFLILPIGLWAASVMEFETLHANFAQQVTNDQNQTLRYTGQVWLKKPDLALWQYETPIEKTIYLHGNQVTLIEPELFQATRFESELSLNILEAWNQSRPHKPGERIATVNQNRILIQHDSDFIRRVSYRDTLDNQVAIEFLKPVKNPRLDPGLFMPEIPKGFDLIIH